MNSLCFFGRDPSRSCCTHTDWGLNVACHDVDARVRYESEKFSSETRFSLMLAMTVMLDDCNERYYRIRRREISL